MSTDKKRNNVKNLIEKGHITTLREILEYYQITPIIKYMKSSHQRLTRYFNNATLFRFGEIQKLGAFFDVDDKFMFELVYNQLQEDKELKKKKKAAAKKD